MYESEEVKQLADLKSRLERKLRDLEDEISSLKSIIGIIDAQLMEKSFKRAEIAAVPPVTPPSVAPAAVTERLPVAIPTEFKEVIPLKDRDGRLLANLYVSDNVAKITPSEDLTLSVNTPPFQSFLVNRVLEAMATKDKEEAEAGKIASDKAFGYKIIQEEDKLKEIILWNYRDQARLREIRSSARWTLERMLEKG